MYFLSGEERLQLAEFVVTKAAGRVAVVATGNSDGGSMEEQAASCTKMAAVPGIDAVVVLTCMLAEEGDPEDVWKANATKLMKLTDCPLGLYEVPIPYQRILSSELLAWCAASGRFLFHKDTCCVRAQIEAKIKAVQALGDKASAFRFYNANIETINFSNSLGGAGFSGISGNYYPFIMSAMCPGSSQDTSLTEEDKDKLQAFISLGETAIVQDGSYPFSAKKYLGLFDQLPITDHCRSKDFPPYNEVQMAHLVGLKHTMELVCAAVGITVVEPSLTAPTVRDVATSKL